MMKTFAAVACAVCIGLAGHAAHAQEGGPAPQNDPIAKSVLPPELIMQYQKAIQLTEAQKSSVIAEVKRAQGRIVDVQWDMQRALEPLVESLARDRPDEPTVLAQLDKVLAAEREFKRAHLSLAVRLKNILTPEQQRMLIELRANPPRPGDPIKPAGQR
jgi:Spy/CpxP family protein refolding chaperone